MLWWPINRLRGEKKVELLLEKERIVSIKSSREGSTFNTISTCRATNHGCHGNNVGNNKYLNGRKKQ
jgi:hypothetical protein